MSKVPPVYFTIYDSIEPSKVKGWMQVIQREISDSSVAEIVIQLSSSGGGANDALVFFNFLRGLPCRVTIKCLGNVESAAIVVLLAGEQRYSVETAQIVFHNLMISQSAGMVSASRLMHSVELLRRSEQEIIKIVTSRSKMSQEESASLIKDGAMLGVADAIRHGLVHGICDGSVPAGARNHIL